MREIKFRAWVLQDEVDGEYIAAEYMEDDVESFHDPLYEHKQGNIVLMQFIEQKDSDGNEIYEGDVVTWYNPMIETGERMTGVVVYDTKQATYKKCPINLYKANAGDGGYTGFEFRWYDNVKVLGNIYENPELLQNQTK
ncbi:YopX family protein [Paenibacillus jamilae]|uniref:YopX protein domain-containing protein n=3 Tax=Bacillus thuringiensis TaxID=1428 RepID=A0AAX1HLG5_BACTU|nr:MULTISPECIES: YopX family protein [Bacillus cereus group]MEB4839419.1 YopX family protein [Paenibacillus jamilae]MEB8583009.1 YopX family protein [Bacillus cereus]MCR6855424.1 YopX family protein [Bacillus thuringiensis]MCR6856708.1 YopX family protein [Bacillus thuringiensis]MDR4282409.1 hypothetical protein [Bacillus thuringiensis]